MDNTTLMLFFATLPVILILVFVYSKDKNKEPLKLLMTLFFFGILSCFLVLTISDTLSTFIPFMNKTTEQMNYLEVILYAFLGVALIEELCKWIAVYSIGYTSKEFDEVYDIIVYSVFVSLGFAFIENVLYIFSSGDLITAIIRSISAVPGHACDAIFMGYYLSLAKQYYFRNRKDLEKKYILLSILIPTILHGIYDYCLMAGFFSLIIIFLIFIVFLYMFSIKKLKEVYKTNKKVHITTYFCRNCGAPIKGEICQNCGIRHE